MLLSPVVSKDNCSMFRTVSADLTLGRCPVSRSWWRLAGWAWQRSRLALHPRSEDKLAFTTTTQIGGIYQINRWDGSDRGTTLYKHLRAKRKKVDFNIYEHEISIFSAPWVNFDRPQIQNSITSFLQWYPSLCSISPRPLLSISLVTHPMFWPQRMYNWTIPFLLKFLRKQLELPLSPLYYKQNTEVNKNKGCEIQY
jgi:hypothetical protein